MSVLSPTNFDDNTEDLLHLLTDSWDSPFKATIIESKWTRDYLTKLTSLPLDELLHEPAELREEQAKAKRDAQQLAFRDYPSFLHAQTCRHEAEETLDGLDVHLGDFLSSVPELQQACEEFGQHAQILKEERGKITSVLEHQNVLTDLLEIPQLMETCVWNGYYSEAMDLASHVRLLQVRYPLSVIKTIQQQVQASSDLMLVQLISHLRKPIRLAAAMNVIGFLRRMDVFETETELRMVFLRCRHDFLQQRLVRVKRDISEDIRQRSVDAFEYLKRLIDVMREQMFEIGTQYISIFSNEQGTLLSDYMVHITGLIKTALSTYLPMIEDTSALTSLLTQLQYCGMSLGRIGLDFRHIFVHSFEEAVQPMILRWIDASTEDLVKLIVKSTQEASAPSTWMSSKIVSQNNSNSSSENEVRRHAFQPPMLLVGYPSLAIFTNGILSAFNALRLLPAVSLYLPIQNHLDACFLEIGNTLKQYSDQAASHIPDEITYLQSFSAAYVRCCIPYLKSCLVDGIYSNLSIPSSVDEDMELLLVAYLPVMKTDVVVEELKELNESELPKKEEQETIDFSIKDENEGVDRVKDDAPFVKNDTIENTDVLDSTAIIEQHNPQIDEGENPKNIIEESVDEKTSQQMEEKESVNKLITPNEDFTDAQDNTLKSTTKEEDETKADISISISSTELKDPVIEDPVDQDPIVTDTSSAEETVIEQSTVNDPAVDEEALHAENVAFVEESVKVNPVVEESTKEEIIMEGNPALETLLEEDSAVEMTHTKYDVDKNVLIETTVVDDSSLKENPAIIKESKTIDSEPLNANKDTIILDDTSNTKEASKKPNNTELDKENTHTEEQPSTTEHTEEEHKGEGDVKATPEKKQPKKSKKHKGKKGRR